MGTDPRMKNSISFGSFHLHPAERLLERTGEPVHLGGRALDILIVLVEQAGEVVSHKDLYARAWPNIEVNESALRVQVATLRKALADGQGGMRYVANIAGRGYCFVAPVSAA